MKDAGFVDVTNGTLIFSAYDTRVSGSQGISVN